MILYCAPMDGLTGYVFRNAQRAYFKSADKYFAPFISASQSGSFKTRELQDILPENNQGIVLIPQLLTNNADHFVQTSKAIKLLGYPEINLNLGCPSGTVVAKKKGSGFLALRAELAVFLDEIFAQSITRISIKARLGKDQPEEFYQLIEIFNRYPISELIIHPRIQKDFYKNVPNLRIFKDALALSKNPVCYNGDIFTVKEFHEFTAEFPDVDTMMLGRGLVGNPGLISDIVDRKKLDKPLLKAFHDQVYAEYKRIIPGDRNVLFKMKELWLYMATVFSENAKYTKKIMKSERMDDYEQAVSSLFREQEIMLIPG